MTWTKAKSRSRTALYRPRKVQHGHHCPPLRQCNDKIDKVWPKSLESSPSYPRNFQYFPCQKVATRRACMLVAFFCQQLLACEGVGKPYEILSWQARTVTDFSPLLKESDAAADPAKILNAGSNVFFCGKSHSWYKLSKESFRCFADSQDAIWKDPLMMNLKKKRRRRSIWPCKKHVMKESAFGRDNGDDNALCVKHCEEEDDEVEELDQDVRNPGWHLSCLKPYWSLRPRKKFGSSSETVKRCQTNFKVKQPGSGGNPARGSKHICSGHHQAPRKCEQTQVIISDINWHLLQPLQECCTVQRTAFWYAVCTVCHWTHCTTGLRRRQPCSKLEGNTWFSRPNRLRLVWVRPCTAHKG